MTKEIESREDSDRDPLRAAATLVRQGQYANAEKALRSAAAARTADWTAHHNHALVLRQLGRLANAQGAALRAIALNPAARDPYALLADIAIEEANDDAAIGLLRRLAQLQPDDWQAQHNLGVVLRRSGKIRAAIQALARAAAHPASTWDPSYLLATTLILVRQGVSAIKPLVRAVTINPKLLERKRLFYQLRSIFEPALRHIGVAKTLDLAKGLFRDIYPLVSPADLLSKRPETKRALIAATCRQPASPYDAGIDGLVAGRPETAMQIYIQSILSDATPGAKYDSIIEEGPDRGHPIWHAMNPFFYIWANGRAEQPAAVQTNWRTNPAVGVARRPSAKFELPQDWNVHGNLTRASLARFLASRKVGIFRVLDVGCGDGSWLAFMADHCGLPVGDLMGTDLHQTRADDARELMTVVAQKHGLSPNAARALAERAIFQSDALDWDTTAFAASCGPIDLITLFVITGCFDDSQLEAFLDRISRIGARWIFETNVIDTWDMWIGRQDTSPFYRRHGYQLIESCYLGEVLEKHFLPYLVLPQKYWAARQYNVYERID